jgi:TolA-binding protein
MRTSKILLVLCIVSLALTLAPAAGQAQAQDAKASTWKSLLADLWARLRAATPRAKPVVASATVTAGLRGSEATESALKPYWKGAREDDPATLAARQALERAQALADAGDYAQAARAFDAFLMSNPQSPLAPNARFGGALAHAALGERARASQALEEFLKQDPDHPLAADARRALAALR